MQHQPKINDANAHVIAYWQNKYARGTGYKPLRREYAERGAGTSDGSEALSTAALFDALSYAAQCTERRKRERQLQLLRAI